jgi:isopenicillin N synthase-like dioxygenase
MQLSEYLLLSTDIFGSFKCLGSSETLKILPNSKVPLYQTTLTPRTCRRGWIPPGIEKTSGFARLQNKELDLIKDKLSDQRVHCDLLDITFGTSLHVTNTIGQESYDLGPPEDLAFPNVWPEEVDMPGFRSFMERYFKRCQEICRNIIAAIEFGLDVASGVLGDKIGNDSSELRFNYYPEAPLESLTTGLSKRCWPHTDFGLITLLFQDYIGGLELQDNRNPGSFVPVVSGGPGLPTEMVLNTADCLSRWTNNKIRAGVHQVNVPYEMTQQKDGIVPTRYSCPFFYKAAYDVLVGPLPEFVSKEKPAIYDEITAIEYHKQRVGVVLQEA